MKYLYNLLLLILFFQLIFSYQNHHRPKKTKSLFFRFSEKKHLSKQFADSVPETEVKVLKEGWLRLSSVQLMNTHLYPNIPLAHNNFAKVEVIRHNLDSYNKTNFYSPGYPYRKNSHFVKDSGTIPTIDAFWFRISGTYLYYTETSNDMVVLGAISISNIQSIKNSTLGANCFFVSNIERDKWNICADDQHIKIEWMCTVSEAIGKPCNNETYDNPLIIEEKRIVRQPILLIPLPSPYCNEDWNYTVHGNDWNCKCSEGFSQSPINVERRCVENLNSSTSFTFLKVEINLVKSFYTDNMLIFKSKNHNSDDVIFAKIIDLDYTEYICTEIRFHTPGEHTIDGRSFPMEIQIICKPITDGDYKKKAGIAFLVNQVPGKTNKFFDFIDFMNLPNIYKTESDLLGINKENTEINVEELFKDFDDLYEFNGYFNYWRYEGSLTSPPCDEHLRWFIVEKPVKIGYAALEMVKDILTIPNMMSGNKYIADLRYPPNPDGNNRDLQQIRDRTIFYFDTKGSFCVPQPKKIPKKAEGHYEKISKTATSYFYVPGDKPSGINGSFVIPKWEAFGLESPEDERERDINNIFYNTE